MELPVELNDKQQIAKVVFAGKDDFGFLAGWRQKLGDDTNPFRVEAMDLARLAIDRFSAHSLVQPYVKSINDIVDHITFDSACEVAGFVLLKCTWFPDSDVIGICHFRRTWCNNIILDYLAAHPFCTKPPDEYPYKVRGAGTALLYFLSRLAQRLNCGNIWGEATRLSYGFYMKKFSLDSVEDLILTPRNNFVEFAERLDLSAKPIPDDVRGKSPAVEEMYKFEEENPPMAGNRFAVFSPPRKMARHFIDLAHHDQIEIARVIGLFQEEDKVLPDNELFLRLYRRAAEQGKLSALWSEVENRHHDGRPDENPY